MKLRIELHLVQAVLSLVLSTVSVGALATGIGNVDSIANNNLIGWTCQYADPNDTQDDVAIYAGGPYPGGTLVGYGWANNPGYTTSDHNFIKSACATPSGFHRFALGLLAGAAQYTGTNRALYVYDQKTGELLSGGVFSLPPAPPAPGTAGPFPFTTITNLLNSGQATVKIEFVGDSHTGAFGNPTYLWGQADTQAWIYQLGMMLGTHYPNYKVQVYQRAVHNNGGIASSSGADSSGNATCGLGEQDFGPFTVKNPAATKVLTLIQDGIGGSNLERYMARLTTTQSLTLGVFPTSQSVTLVPGNTVDAVIMMFGVNDWWERYTPAPAPPPTEVGLNCYPGGSTTLGGGYGNANLRIRGTNDNLGFQSGNPPSQFAAAYTIAINGTKSAFGIGGTIPFIGLMTPLNVPGLLYYDGQKPGNLQPWGTVGFPLNGQMSQSGDDPSWTLNLTTYQASVFSAAQNLGIASNVLDLYSWVYYNPSTGTPPHTVANSFFYEGAATSYDLHLNAAGNYNLAQWVYNRGFGLQ